MNTLELLITVFIFFWVGVWIVWTLGNFARNKLMGR